MLAMAQLEPAVANINGADYEATMLHLFGAQERFKS